MVTDDFFDVLGHLFVYVFDWLVSRSRFLDEKLVFYVFGVNICFLFSSQISIFLNSSKKFVSALLEVAVCVHVAFLI